MALGVYTTVADVQALQPALTLGAGQNPTVADVQTYIGLVAADLDLALLRAGYDAPVDFSVTVAPVAAGQLRALNAKGALAMAVAGAPSFPPALRDQIQKTYDTALQDFTKIVPRLDLPSDPTDTEPRAPGVTTIPALTGRNRPYFRRYERF